jgi:hypothetical protein
MQKLRQALDDIRGMAFPKHPQSDALDEWLLELAESDAFIVGNAVSVLSGENPAKIKIIDLNLARAALQEIEVRVEDQDIYSQCLEYLDGLDQIQKSLILAGANDSWA